MKHVPLSLSDEGWYIFHVVLHTESRDEFSHATLKTPNSRYSAIVFPIDHHNTNENNSYHYSYRY